MSDSRRNRKNRPLEVEPLEALTLLSGVAGLVASPPIAAAVSTSITSVPVIVPLDGATHGSYRTDRSLPDVGTTYHVTTVGRFAHLGIGNVSGTLTTLGNIQQGQATGRLLVRLPGGTVTLALTGPTQNGFSTLPSEFSYSIVKGTGKFHNHVGDPVGHGVVDVVIRPPIGGLRGPRFGAISLAFHSLVVVIA